MTWTTRATLGERYPVRHYRQSRTQLVEATSGIIAPSRFLRPWVVIGAGAIASVTTVLAAVTPGTLATIDQPWSEAWRNGKYVDVANVVSRMGATEVVVPLMLIGMAVVWRHCRALGYALPATVGAGLLANVVMKVVVGRDRPPDAITGVNLNSYPSGHAIQAVLLFGLVPLVLFVLTHRRKVLWSAIVLLPIGVAAVGAARIHLGAHWPTDVFGGITIGAFLLLFAEWYVTTRGGSCVGEDCPFQNHGAATTVGAVTTTVSDRLDETMRKGSEK